MKLTLSALSRYLLTSLNCEQICETLTKIGLEVESCHDSSAELAQFSVAKILDAKPHPNSSKLKICSVQTNFSSEPLQVVCGAANARAGIKVAFAKIGSTIPVNKMIIKKAKIAGIESCGMLCSSEELEINTEEGLKSLYQSSLKLEQNPALVYQGTPQCGDAEYSARKNLYRNPKDSGISEGIIEIAEKFEIGTKISEVFGRNETVIEINVTPNRGDCLGIYGIARDLAAAGAGELKNLEVIPSISTSFAFGKKVLNDSLVEESAIQACSYGFFRQIRGIKNQESPKWLKESLAAVGVNSISAVVDVINFVMHELNRPMHAYDASKIEGEIVIRFAKENEKITSLKNEEITCDSSVLLISDQKKPLAIAGIIGSKACACELETTEIIIESVYFNPEIISASGRKLNLLSDSRHRFERGVDPNSCKIGIELATKLIMEICGGSASEMLEIGFQSPNKIIEFDFGLIKSIVGIEINIMEATKILLALGFEISGVSQENSKLFKNKILVGEPEFTSGEKNPYRNSLDSGINFFSPKCRRPRIAGSTDIPKQDFVRVSRSFGISEVKSDLGTNLSCEIKVPSHRHDIFSPIDLVEEVIRIYGYDHIKPCEKYFDKTIGYSQKPVGAVSSPNFCNQIRNFFVNQGMVETISWSFVDSKLAKIFGDFSPQLLLANPISSELDILRSNLAIGLISTYSRNVLRGFNNLALFEIGNVFSQKHESNLAIAGLRAGKNKPIDQFHEQREADIFDIKRDFLSVIEIAGINPKSLQFNEAEPFGYFHPYRFANVLLGKEIIGCFGEIHPTICKHFGLKNRVNYFEVFVSKLPKTAQKTSNSSAKKALQLNDLQMVERDFAFLIDENFAIGKLIKAVEEADKSMISKVCVFDIYVGNKISAGKKSVALRVEIQPQLETLNSAQIEEISQKIMVAANQKCGADLRT